jgi:hypothetical protein
MLNWSCERLTEHIGGTSIGIYAKDGGWVALISAGRPGRGLMNGEAEVINATLRGRWGPPHRFCLENQEDGYAKPVIYGYYEIISGDYELVDSSGIA